MGRIRNYLIGTTEEIIDEQKDRVVKANPANIESIAALVETAASVPAMWYTPEIGVPLFVDSIFRGTRGLKASALYQEGRFVGLIGTTREWYQRFKARTQ